MNPDLLNAMLVPFLFAVGSVALGSLLALLPGVGARSLGPIQTFSVAAALTVVIVHLIPESADVLGLWALVGFAAGLVAPLAIEALLERIARMRLTASPLDHDVITAEVGFAGLLVHQVGDGIGLWVTSGTGESSLNAAFALSAHTVPLATLFVLRFATLKGRRSALIHAGGLAAASAVGILVGTVVPASVISQFNPWVEAVVAGLLLHVITHDLHIEKNRTTVIKVLDMVALVVGVGLTLVASHQHGSGSQPGHLESGREAFLQAFFDLAIAAAPVLFAGLVVSAALLAASLRIRRALIGTSGRAPALRGVLLAAFSPAAASSLTGAARELRHRGLSTAFVIACVLGVPALGLETIGLTFMFLGWQVSIVRLAGAVLFAIVAGSVAAVRAGGSVDAEHRHSSEPPHFDGDSGGLSAFVRALDGLLLHVSPWMVVGLIAAAYIQTLVPAAQVGSVVQAGLDVPLAVLVSIPTFVNAASVVPLASVLLEKGVSPGAVVAGLVIGPAVNIAVISFVRRSFGASTAWILFATGILISLGLAFGLNLALAGWVPDRREHAYDHGFVPVATALLLLAFTARSLWQTGLRAWVSSILGTPAGEAEAGHVH